MSPETKQAINRDPKLYVVTYGPLAGAVVDYDQHDFLFFSNDIFSGDVVLEYDIEDYLREHPEHRPED